MISINKYKCSVVCFYSLNIIIGCGKYFIYFRENNQNLSIFNVADIKMLPYILKWKIINHKNN